MCTPDAGGLVVHKTYHDRTRTAGELGGGVARVLEVDDALCPWVR